MAPRSESLFHFMRKEEYLRTTLQSGFWPRYCLEDIRWQRNDICLEDVAYPMLCFCDIPLGRITEHVEFYGSFGLGMTKEWGTKHLLNPVMYVNGYNKCTHSLAMMAGHLSCIPDPEVNQKVRRYVLHFVAHVKPTNGRMRDMHGHTLEKEFYQESEWRFVPDNKNVGRFLRKEEFECAENLENANKATSEHCRLTFNAADVKYIFVKSDADIPEMMRFIQHDLTRFTVEDRLLLMSRVTSLETITRDV